MKYHIFLALTVLFTFLNFARGLHRASPSSQNLTINSEFKNVNTCEMQRMAQEMIENLLKEKDIFTSIMETLQHRLSQNSVCGNEAPLSICKHDASNKKTQLDCTSETYENLIGTFTRRKLCHSQIAFGNTLLKTFIEKEPMKNAFNIMINNYNTVYECVDNELKEIYSATMRILKELKFTVIDLSEKLWSDKIINVLKKRENLIAAVFCDLRKGNVSVLTKNSLLYQNFGILKINDKDLLDEAFTALTDYYYYFPYFATKLLSDNGLVKKLIEIHEKLTTYRAKHIVDKLNEQSKDSVIVNENVHEALNNYNHHNSENMPDQNKSFLETSEVEATKNSEDDNSKKNNEKTETSQNTNNTNTNKTGSSSNSSDSTKQDIQNEKSKTDSQTSTTNEVVTENNTNNTSGSNNNNATETTTSRSGNEQKVSEKKGDNPLYSIESLKEHNIIELLKKLIKDINIVKFNNNDPTNYIDEDGIKKLIENNFLDLNNNTMLVRLFIKPQAVILSVIQSFILMTPSPEKDARMYCKKTLVNGNLIDGVTTQSENEEEDLVSKFASKYNMVYEKIKLEELKEIELNNTIHGGSTTLSAVQLKNDPNKKTTNMLNSEASEHSNQSMPMIAIVNDPNGSNIDKLVDENVDVIKLSSATEPTYMKPTSHESHMKISVWGIFIITFVLFTYF